MLRIACTQHRQWLYIHTQGRFNNHTVHSLYRIMVTETSVVGVMKIGNAIPRAGLEHTSLTFQACVLTITPHRLPWCHHYPHTFLSMQLLAPAVSADYYTIIHWITKIKVAEHSGREQAQRRFKTKKVQNQYTWSWHQCCGNCFVGFCGGIFCVCKQTDTLRLDWMEPTCPPFPCLLSYPLGYLVSSGCTRPTHTYLCMCHSTWSDSAVAPTTFITNHCHQCYEHSIWNMVPSATFYPSRFVPSPVYIYICVYILMRIYTNIYMYVFILMRIYTNRYIHIRSGLQRHEQQNV